MVMFSAAALISGLSIGATTAATTAAGTLMVGTAAAIAIDMAIIGAGMSAYGSYQEGEARQQQSEYNAQVYEQEAYKAATNKKITSDRYDRAKRQLAGKAMANAGRSGLAYDGSFVDVLNDSLTQLEMDKEMEKDDFNTKISRGFSAAANAREQGKDYSSAGKTAAAATLITSSSDIYSKFGK